MDKAKIDKMSGEYLRYSIVNLLRWLTLFSDQQIGQLYELMQAIRKQELEENDPEHKPDE
jgi:hypothetical protein